MAVYLTQLTGDRKDMLNAIIEAEKGDNMRLEYVLKLNFLAIKGRRKVGGKQLTMYAKVSKERKWTGG